MACEEVLSRLAKEGLLESYEKRRGRRYVARAGRLAVKRVAEEMRSAGAQLSAVTCVDLGGDFELIYHYDLGGCLVDVKVRVSKALPRVESVSEVYPAAELYEREALEMFGVRFEGLKRPEKLYLPDNWPDWYKPLRKGW